MAQQRATAAMQTDIRNDDGAMQTATDLLILEYEHGELKALEETELIDPAVLEDELRASDSALMALHEELGDIVLSLNKLGWQDGAAEAEGGAPPEEGSLEGSLPTSGAALPSLPHSVLRLILGALDGADLCSVACASTALRARADDAFDRRARRLLAADRYGVALARGEACTAFLAGTALDAEHATEAALRRCCRRVCAVLGGSWGCAAALPPGTDDEHGQRLLKSGAPRDILRHFSMLVRQCCASADVGRSDSRTLFARGARADALCRIAGAAAEAAAGKEQEEEGDEDDEDNGLGEVCRRLAERELVGALLLLTEVEPEEEDLLCIGADGDVMLLECHLLRCVVQLYSGWAADGDAAEVAGWASARLAACEAGNNEESDEDGGADDGEEDEAEDEEDDELDGDEIDAAFGAARRARAAEVASMQRAAELKASGNALFQQGRHAEALLLYHDALAMMDRAVWGADVSDEQFDATERDLLLNAALCSLKLGVAVNCVMCCDAALQIDEHCAKAYFRRGLALRQIPDADAGPDLELAAELAPKDKLIRKALSDWQQSSAR